MYLLCNQYEIVTSSSPNIIIDAIDNDFSHYNVAKQIVRNSFTIYQLLILCLWILNITILIHYVILRYKDGLKNDNQKISDYDQIIQNIDYTPGYIIYLLSFILLTIDLMDIYFNKYIYDFAIIRKYRKIPNGLMNIIINNSRYMFITKKTSYIIAGLFLIAYIILIYLIPELKYKIFFIYIITRDSIIGG